MMRMGLAAEPTEGAEERRGKSQARAPAVHYPLPKKNPSGTGPEGERLVIERY